VSLPPQKTKTHTIKTLTKQHCATASHTFSCALLGNTRHSCNKHTHTHTQTKFVFFPQGKNQTPKLQPKKDPLKEKKKQQQQLKKIVDFESEILYTKRNDIIIAQATTPRLENFFFFFFVFARTDEEGGPFVSAFFLLSYN
jgi:hypothetical protein